MGELIDFLLSAFLIYYIIKMVLRFVFPSLFQSAMNRAQQQYRQTYGQQQYGQQQQNYDTHTGSTGKIKVDYVPPQTKRKGSVPDSMGEVVDYEEVK